MSIIGRCVDGLVGKVIVMLTSIGVFIDPFFVVVATIVLIVIVITIGYRKGERGFHLWALRLGEIFVAFLLWQILFVTLRFITYAGGSAEEIWFKHTISNIAAYLIVIALLVFFEDKRPSSLDST